MSRSPSSSSSSSSSSTAGSSDEDNNITDEQKAHQYQHRPSKYAGLSTAEFWALKKKERKARVKARKQAAREVKQAEWATLPDEEKQRMRDAAHQKHEARNRANEAHLAACRRNMDPAQTPTPTLIFDMQFATTMNGRDVKSTSNQIKLSYVEMKKAAFILRPAIFSGGGKLQQQQNGGDDDEEQQPQKQQDGDTDTATTTLDKERGDHMFPMLREYTGFKHLPPAFVDDSVASLPRESTVYLTADSPNLLWELKPGESYVVGAFVDHNRNKGATMRFAEQHGMRTARFPINESIEVGNAARGRCKALTVNHVVSVLLSVAAAATTAGGGSGSGSASASAASDVTCEETTGVVAHPNAEIWKNALISVFPTRTKKKSQNWNYGDQDPPSRRGRDGEGEEKKKEDE